MSKKFVMSFSGGKDSTLALYRMIKKGYTPIGLLVTVKKGKSSSWTHSINKELLNKVSQSLDIPLMLVECEVSEYEAKFKETLEKAKENGMQVLKNDAVLKVVNGETSIEEMLKVTFTAQ